MEEFSFPTSSLQFHSLKAVKIHKEIAFKLKENQIAAAFIELYTFSRHEFCMIQGTAVLDIDPAENIMADKSWGIQGQIHKL